MRLLTKIVLSSFATREVFHSNGRSGSRRRCMHILLCTLAVKAQLAKLVRKRGVHGDLLCAIESPELCASGQASLGIADGEGKPGALKGDEVLSSVGF